MHRDVVGHTLDVAEELLVGEDVDRGLAVQKLVGWVNGQVTRGHGGSPHVEEHVVVEGGCRPPVAVRLVPGLTERTPLRCSASAVQP